MDTAPSGKINRINISGILSGVNHSTERLGCPYVDYLSTGREAPESVRKRACSLDGGLSIVEGSGQGNWSVRNAPVALQGDLYDANVRTVGEFIAYLSETGKVGDMLTIHTLGAQEIKPGREKGYCAYLRIKDANQGVPVNRDPRCYRLVPKATTCEAQANTDIDHGIVLASQLSNGEVKKENVLTYVCPVPVKLRFYLNDSGASIVLPPLDGVGKIESKLYLNDHDLHKGGEGGVLLNLSQGYNVLKLRSVLKGSGVGSFSGSVVLISTYE
ncbi:hypothetical protein [Enterobacter sp. J49]|uniref:hypothetical protein n=1 Tax=Enterobacter sp. J49 TaxID=1903627 RepID=UPI0011782BC0|nr:hypothetical protein [Enterobacter sp. J49]